MTKEEIEQAAVKYASENYDSSHLDIDDHFKAGADFASQKPQTQEGWVSPEQYPAMAKHEAINFANWLSNTVIAGRTIYKLWNDYVDQVGAPTNPQVRDTTPNQ